uniref:BCD1 alpha/beta domain-containing protein n=1 Tax=Timema poppense TaxID=170557 RepID=A0A7R9DV26_TIMPO|nr:unnamed protein product [Timema poppensis]
MKGERTASVLMKGENSKCVDERLGENVRIGSHVNKYLDPAVCDLSLREHLQFYQSAGLSGVHLMLRAEKVPKAGVWYYELDPALTLKENLAGKCVIEFPTVYVVLEHHKHLFETLDSDEEFEEYDVMSRDFPNKFNGTGRRGFPRTNRNGVVNRGTDKTNNFLFNHPDNSDSSDAEQNVKKPKLDIPPYHGCPATWKTEKSQIISSIVGNFHNVITKKKVYNLKHLATNLGVESQENIQLTPFHRTCVSDYESERKTTQPSIAAPRDRLATAIKALTAPTRVRHTTKGVPKSLSCEERLFYYNLEGSSCLDCIVDIVVTRTMYPVLQCSLGFLVYIVQAGQLVDTLGLSLNGGIRN